MNIEIPDDEAAARRERVVVDYTLDQCRRLHDDAVADNRLSNAADWSYRIALWEWTPTPEFKVGDVVRTLGGVEFTVRGVYGNVLWDGSFSYLAPGSTLVKSVDDE